MSEQAVGLGRRYLVYQLIIWRSDPYSRELGIPGSAVIDFHQNGKELGLEDMEDRCCDAAGAGLL